MWRSLVEAHAGCRASVIDRKTPERKRNEVRQHDGLTDLHTALFDLHICTQTHTYTHISVNVMRAFVSISGSKTELIAHVQTVYYNSFPVRL